MKAEIESFGRASGLTPVAAPGASFGYAMMFGSQSRVTAAVPLDTGQYTLLVRCYAPSGDADGFYVEIAGKRRRRTAPIGRWGTLAFPFSTVRSGPVSIAIIGQEPGLWVDAVAVVRGRAGDSPAGFRDLPGPTDRTHSPSIEALPRLMFPCRLARRPEGPFRADSHTVFLEHFDRPRSGAEGDHAWISAGKWGGALRLDMPDGRFGVDARSLDLGPAGTVEWWVRPRPAQELWWDQGWHYFLYLRARDDRSFQLDLSRHPLTGLRLVASDSEGPYYTDAAPGSRQWVQVSTRNLDNARWHHILVSWDVRGLAFDYLWLLVDGAGVGMRFPHRFRAAGFSKIEFANTPSNWTVPFLPMDGAIDEIRIRNVSVEDRLAE